ncbi:GTPase IMAP family member 7-like [Boleophthalmus pectinirostris]|uniref:GTPase IMAP family member 7-like n=1 Tax=Boleophthalmus pectinirostris TaxID=150288 RepID=UPI0024323C59|nr:GTPase IMAP family member 7-like [Boleophthalmus pectinirostris]
MSTEENAASLKECTTSALDPDSDWRIVLVGRTGSGKSSTANTILGRSAFWVETSPCSITSKCRKQSGQVNKVSISVVDTPGFFHTSMSLQEVIHEMGQCIKLYSPGPHLFILTVQICKFTQEEKDCLDWIKATFGSEVLKYTLVLFTCGDKLHGKRIEDYVGESEELSEFVSGCHGGYHVFDNSNTESSEQIMDLMKKIDKMVSENENGFYTRDMFDEAERAMKEVQERMMGENVSVSSPQKATNGLKLQGEEVEGRRLEDEEARKRAERLFWCELVTAMGKGAAEGAGIVGKNKGKGKAIKKIAALAASPLSIGSAAKVVGGAMREGTKVFSKHRKTFLH